MTKIRVLKRRKDHIKQHYHVNSLVSKVNKAIKPYAKKIEFAGSYRRKVDPSKINDIDVVVIPKDKVMIRKNLARIGKIISGGDKQVFAKVDDIQFDVFYADKEDFGSQLMTRTGPAGANIGHRASAKKKGWLLNQYGLFDAKGHRIANTEKGIYEKLGLAYRKPEDRGLPR